jgi:hypothetical protein
MIRYIGTKVIFAKPMTRGEYNDYRGWTVPANEDPLDAGYLVEYMDGGASNHAKHAGYVSWSPKDVFDAAYRKAVGLSFSMALEAIKHGLRVKRVGWSLSTLSVQNGRIVLTREGDEPRVYAPTQSEIFADDWITV